MPRLLRFLLPIIAGACVVLAAVWAGAAIGRPAPPVRVYEVVAAADPGAAFNVLFVARTGDNFGDMTDPTDRSWLIDYLAQSTIGDGLMQNRTIREHRSRLNFWLADGMARLTPVPGGCPTVTLPDMSGLPLAPDAIIVLHRSPMDDCAQGIVATADLDQPGTILHELSHSLFHLPDEYCCYGGYWDAWPVLYRFSAEPGDTRGIDAEEMPGSGRGCTVSSVPGAQWIRGNGCIPTIMTSSKDVEGEYGIAGAALLRDRMERAFGPDKPQPSTPTPTVSP